MASNPKKQRLASDEGSQVLPKRILELRSGDKECFFDMPKRERGIVKHSILRRDLQAWLPILGNNNDGDIIYVEGFAGTGKYIDKNGGEEDGSPLVAYEAAVSHNRNGEWKAKVIMIFIEKDEGNARKLKENLSQAEIELGKFHNTTTITWEVRTGLFEDEMPLILAKWRSAPVLLFADPFGYSQITLGLLNQILHHPTIDLLVTVMDSSVRRWGMEDKYIDTMAKVFGVSPQIWVDDLRPKLEGLYGEAWRDKFMEIYTEYMFPPNLEVGKDIFTLQFAMRREGNNAHIYHLLFVTKHEKGMLIMKDAMWKQSQKVDELVFSEYDKQRGIMIDLPAMKTERIRITVNFVKEKFKGQKKISGKAIIKEILLRSIYKVYRNGLKAGLQDFETSESKQKVRKGGKFEDKTYDFTIKVKKVNRIVDYFPRASKTLPSNVLISACE